jgi:hypothetical protein
MAITKQAVRTETQFRESSISRRSRLTLAIAWAVLFPLGLSLEPTPAASSEPLWGVALGIGLMAALGATVVGLARRQRWASGSSIGASLIFTTAVFACPATGHHAFGLWWFGEFGAALALVAISTVVFLRDRR